MDKVYYLYYRLFTYYKKGNDIEIFAKISTYVCMIGLLWMNILTLLFFISSLFFEGNSLLDNVFGRSSAFNKFVVTPLLIFPLFVFLFLLINKRIKQKIAVFDAESAVIRKKRGVRVVVYIVISFVMLMLSITSPLYL